MKSLIFIIVLSSLGFCYGNSEPCEPLYPDCPHCNDVNLPLTQVGDKYYYFEVNSKANWFSASQFCNFHGMRLASIENEKENQALTIHIKTVLNFPKDQRIWTSGNDLGQQFNWFWFSTGKRWSYTNWLPGQPDNTDNDERCVDVSLRMDSGERLGWNDLFCKRENPFICQVY